MGDLTKSHGDQWRYVINDFSGGLYKPGAVFAQVNESGIADTRYGSTQQCYESFRGELTPVVGDAKFNATSVSATGDIEFIFPYILPSAQAGPYLELVSRVGTLYSITATNASVTEGSLGGVAAKRYGAQSLGYCWISQSNGQMYRFNKSNPGGGTTVSNAGTKSPTNAPTLTVGSSGGSLTTGFGYRYRYAWEYGTGRELGMGWKQGAASAIVTPTAGQQITITMDANPPTSWSHAVSRALFRNTQFFPNNFFLVTRTPYAGSSLSTTYQDGIADANIENGEECDPPQPQDKTVTTGVYSELLPPTFTFCAIHEGRLWGLDAWVSTTRYPSRAVYSRISSVGPAPRWDQFDTFATVEAAPSDMGAPAGLISWMSNLYALFARGITVLSTDPGIARLPTFATVVAGRGAVSPLATAATPFGIVMMSEEGPILFDGGPNPILLSEPISGYLRNLNLSLMRGGYDPYYQEYSFCRDTGSGTLSDVFTYNFNLKQWKTETDVAYSNLPWSYAAAVGSELHYALASSTLQPVDSDDFIYRRKKGTVNTSLFTGKSLERRYTTWTFDCGMPFVVKRLREVIVYFQALTSFTSASTIMFVTTKDDDTSTSTTTPFPLNTSSRSFKFRYASLPFMSMSIAIVISGNEVAGFPAEPNANARPLAFEVVFEGNPERIYSKAVA